MHTHHARTQWSDPSHIVVYMTDKRFHQAYISCFSEAPFNTTMTVSVINNNKPRDSRCLNNFSWSSL